MNLVITGGGTGGHIFAGVAIAQEFVQQSKANRVLFIGSDYGLETKLVPKAGFPLETVKLGKLVGQSIFQRLLTLFQIPIAVLKCILVLKRFDAEIVVGVGGYAAGPCILAARILGIPTGILEQNAVMGFTNRVSAKLARHVFTAFEEPPQGVAAAKCITTGNPTRSELKPAAVKPTKPFVVFVFGGSQGAAGLNRMMLECAQALLPHKGEIEIIHQTGEKELQKVKEGYQKIGFPAEVHAFIDDMQSRYNKASVVVCRAGSSTISELGATRNAALLVPFPFSAGDHQVHNARRVADSGAAELVLERQGEKLQSGALIAEKILQLMHTPAKLEAMRNQMATFYRPDSAKRIVDTMKVHALGLHQR